MSGPTGGSNDGYYGQNSPTSDTSDFNRHAFSIERVLKLISTATLAEVKKFTPYGQKSSQQGGGGSQGGQSQQGEGGKIAPIGTVNVMPLVNMIDGIGKSSKHEIVNNLPYFRLQSGNQAIIMDPQPGDLVMVVFADRDISAVKKNYKQSNPGSRRRFDMADGICFGVGISNKTPEVYIQFDNHGKIITAVDKGKTSVTWEKDKITVAVGDARVIVQPSKIKAYVSSNLPVVITASRIDLGGDPAPYRVATEAGLSDKVFAVI